MKLLHTSDWHLGQSFMGKSREEEHKAFLAWLLETIEDNRIELLIIAGDIFDTATPPNYALEIYYNFLKQLSHIETLHSTIIVAGNHDSVATLKAPKQLLKVLNVHVLTNGGDEEDVLIPIVQNSELRAIVCAVPFLRDAVIRKAVSGETISEKEQMVNKGIRAYYENVYHKALKLKADKSVPVIATGHLTTVGSRSSESERDIYIGGTLDIAGDYLGKLFDYVALGHLHMNQMVGVNHVRYSGSPIPLSFSEANHTHKVNVVKVEANEVVVEAVDIPLYRELVLLRGNEKQISQALQAIENRHCWIEVHLDDDNPMYANESIRTLASELGLMLLAVKIEKREKELQAKEMNAISLDDLSVEEVFKQRLANEELDDVTLEQDVLNCFNNVYQRVQNR
ncbi:MAG: Exonuclease SbcD [uncultured Sulfurovum sp.]|uniref:Nuclease SbcCD subunit D n=1 Tax=uncultured Sulfurovum sp. TaxID=269237 RepID=A0A6S6S3L5_9BACT|nr:MAG: Exonuclease SbcD [uncultured Sulfurovum sp.]